MLLLIDEIDSRVGDTMVSVLRPVRSGYELGSGWFAQSMILHGMRDVRNYWRVRKLRELLGGQDDVWDLLGQHAEETGRAFAEDAVSEVWARRRGRPWLVNALAFEACFLDEAGREGSRPIDSDTVKEAREGLVP